MLISYIYIKTTSRLIKRLFFFILLLLTTNPTFGWGFWAHKRINRVAVFMLPKEMLGLYKNNIDYLTNHAIDPDKRRYIDSNEAGHHYIDLDHYCHYPCADFPHRFDKASEQFSEDTIQRYGTVVWHIQIVYYQLVNAFKEKNSEKILKLSADLGHYIADAHVPLHTSQNYDGQLTNQKGIHALWESNIPELLGDGYNLYIGKAQIIHNPLEKTWTFVLQSHACLDSVLKFEKQLSDSFPSDKKYTFKRRGADNKRTFSDEFVSAYSSKLHGQVERRMRQSITDIASFWYSAWAEAGQPEINKLILKSGIEEGSSVKLEGIREE